MLILPRILSWMKVGRYVATEQPLILCGPLQLSRKMSTARQRTAIRLGLHLILGHNHWNLIRLCDLFLPFFVYLMITCQLHRLHIVGRQDKYKIKCNRLSQSKFVYCFFLG
jgi:hypothetical protein